MGWVAVQSGTPRAELAVVPVYVSAPAASLNWVHDGAPGPTLPLTAAPLDATPAVGGPTPPLPPEPSFALAAYPWMLALLTYTAGFVVLGALVLLGVFRTRSWVRRARPVTDPRVIAAFGAARDRVGLSRGIIVVESSAVVAPMTVRTAHPVVLLPAGLTRDLSAAELTA